jgi:hypothetical protein
MNAAATLTMTALLCFAAQNGDTQATFEKLAKNLEYFPTWEFAYGRSDKLDRLFPEKLKAPWYAVLAEISSTRHSVKDLASLLRHQDPRVRTLALAALFQRQDPRLLPYLAQSMDDQAKTAPNLQVLRAVAGPEKFEVTPQDYHEQTVGQVATVMVKWWLEPTGHQARDFAAYWAPRKDRTQCAGWYAARLLRATGGISPFQKEREERVRAVRAEVDKLPQPDRDWTLLYAALSATMSGDAVPAFASTKDLLDAARRLGPKLLLDLLQGKALGEDPDLQPEQQHGRGLRNIGIFVLKHATDLLRPEDALTVLPLEGHLGVIAAAHLQPKNASKWLRDALTTTTGKGHLASYRRADLAAALWTTCGLPEIDYLVDWFYGEQVPKNPHSPATGEFLRAAIGQRPADDRKLVAKIVNDPRLEKLDYQSLRSLIETVNCWTKTPVMTHQELHLGWERGTWWPETEADFKVLQGWRATLKGSVASWAK